MFLRNTVRLVQGLPYTGHDNFGISGEMLGCNNWLYVAHSSTFTTFKNCVCGTEQILRSHLIFRNYSLLNFPVFIK